MQMERLEPYIGFAAIFIFTAIVVAFLAKVSIPDIPVHTLSNASSTLAVVPGFTLPPLSLPSFVPEESTPSIAEPQATSYPTPTVLSATTPSPLALPKSTPLQTAAVALRKALVNIMCYVREDSNLFSISGSGIIVDPKGIILTNAHIAQYFLLADRGVSCTIRAGSPAVDRYKAALMYISPAWLETNATVLTQTEPIGTGEYDFAFLAITASATAAALPPSFPSVPLAVKPPGIGTSIVVASYGAQSLKYNQVQSTLFPVVIFGSVKDVFTFATTSVDILALGGSAAAQHGSSGGGVIGASGRLVGTITTSKVSGDLSKRALNAITASYIRSEYENETGQSLDLLLSKSPSAAATDFAPRMPALESIITAHLP